MVSPEMQARLRKRRGKAAAPGSSRAQAQSAAGQPSSVKAEPSGMEIEPLANLNELLENLDSGRATMNVQSDCPLFEIPAEIRNDIFSYVVTEQDGATPIRQTDYWYRPDYTHYRYIETALLRTCRRIWLETHALPRQHITRRIWSGSNDRRPARLGYFEQEAAKAQLNQQDRRSRTILPCETVQVFIQMFNLENISEVKRFLQQAQQNIATRHLIITIRYTDWWWWESNNPLRLKQSWMRGIEFPSSIERLTFEFETRQGKKNELDPLVSQQVALWKMDTEDGRVLVYDPSSLKTTSYLGTDKPGGQSRQHHSARDNDLPGAPAPASGEMYYYVVTLDFIA